MKISELIALGRRGRGIGKEDSGARRGIGRRAAVQQLLAGAGGALMMPRLALGQSIHKYLADLDVGAAGGDAKTDWKPEFLDAHHNESLVALAERIVPGSTKAQANRFIDLLLTVDTQENQKKFVAALGAFEAESRSRFGHSFQGLTEDQQNQLLTAFSTEKPGNAPVNESWSWLAVPTKPSSEPIRITLRDHFENLKSQIAFAYYSSEVGAREMGWNGQISFDSFPGCEHPDGHRLS
jgi:hypothetical protein